MTGLTTRAPLIAAICVAMLMVFGLVWQGWHFMAAEKQRQTRSTASEREAATQSTAIRNDKALASVNLFGDPKAKDQAEQVDTENLPETNLRLVLRGVMAGDDNTTASALIEDSNSETEAYRIDQELPGNATLKSVHANRIIIERSGTLENLYFPEAKGGNGIRVTDASRSSQSNRSAPTQQQSRARQQQGQSTRTPSTSSSRQEEIRSRLEQLRERLRNNSN